MKTKVLKKDLTEGRVWKKLLIFFLPIAAGTCIQQLYNAVDGMIVGRFVGTVALAAVGGSSAQVINLLVGFFTSITAGAAVVIAQIYGAGRSEDVRVASGNAITVLGLLGIALMILGLSASPWLLKLLQTPEDTLSGSVLYLRIYFIGVPFVLILNMESNILRAVGDSFSPFLYMVIGCLSNIILDIVFVIVFHWGIAGVAAATALSQVINMLLLTQRLMLTRESYRLSFHEFRLKGVYLSNMLKLGIPSGAQSSMYAVSNMVIQVGVNTLGTVAVASWAMTSKIDGIFWAVSNALGAAITSFIGQNLGAGRKDRVRQCVNQGLIMAFSITAVLSTLIMLTAKPLLGILTNDPAVISTTYEMMTYFVPYYFTWTLIEVLSAVLRGSGDAIRPVIIIGLGICLFRVVWISTVFTWFGTLSALCLCYAASWIVTSISLLIYYRRSNWMNRRSVIIDK
ncbi:MAG: MATE family efflux transporter [Oscillospiraceae bacterium]|nr:MATE family efflux transporter [Oscillospiraceae bacterium]